MRLRLVRALARFDARTPWFGAGRSIIAVAQLTTLVATPMESLLVPVLNQPRAPHCDGAQGISILCADSGAGLAKWIMIGILILVASGLTPRWTVIPHAWVAFSMAQSIALPDGGENVAQVITLLFIPLGLCDGRPWHWQWPVRPLGQRSRAIAIVASLAIRLQMSAIYFNSGIAKLSTPAWVDGSAEFYIARDPTFGASGPVAPALLWFTSGPVGTAAISWGTIILECLLGVLILGASRARVCALGLGVMLHGLIIMTIGLWSFGLIMIGCLTVVASMNRAMTASMSSWVREGVRASIEKIALLRGSGRTFP